MGSKKGERREGAGERDRQGKTEEKSILFGIQSIPGNADCNVPAAWREASECATQ